MDSARADPKPTPNPLGNLADAQKTLDATPAPADTAIATPTASPAETPAAPPGASASSGESPAASVTPVSSASPVASVSPSATPKPTETPTPAPTPFDINHIQIETSSDIWKKLSDEQGIRTYQERHSAQDVVAFRGETTIPTSLTRIAAVLKDESLRKEWIDSLDEEKILSVTNELEQVEYNHSKVPWPFHDRDFVYKVKVKVNRDTPQKSLVISMASTKSPLQPERDGIVRGEILHSFYYMKEIPGPEPKTEVLIEMALDPKGAIPMWMVNLTQKKWPHNTLLALKKLAMRPDLVVPKEIEDYFKVSQPTGGKSK